MPTVKESPLGPGLPLQGSCVFSRPEGPAGGGNMVEVQSISVLEKNLECRPQTRQVYAFP